MLTAEDRESLPGQETWETAIETRRALASFSQPQPPLAGASLLHDDKNKGGKK